MTASRVFRTICLTLLLVLVLGACGEPSSTEAGGGGGSGNSTSNGSPDDPVTSEPIIVDPGDDPGKPQFVTPTPGMADLHTVDWRKPVVSDDGRTVTVHFWSGVEPCYTLDHVDVQYSADEVTITLFEGHDPDPDANTACIELAVWKATKIQLDEPLGGRKLVDGAKSA
jgi:hypothetical protein